MVTRTTILRKAFLEWSCLHASSSLCYPNSIKGLTTNCLFSQRIYWFLSHAYWTERKVTLWCWTCTHTHIIRSLWYIVEEKKVFKLFQFCFLFPKVRVSVSESCRAATPGDFGEYASNYFWHLSSHCCFCLRHYPEGAALWSHLDFHKKVQVLFLITFILAFSVF